MPSVKAVLKGFVSKLRTGIKVEIRDDPREEDFSDTTSCTSDCPPGLLLAASKPWPEVAKTGEVDSSALIEVHCLSDIYHSSQTLTASSSSGALSIATHDGTSTSLDYSVLASCQRVVPQLGKGHAVTAAVDAWLNPSTADPAGPATAAACEAAKPLGCSRLRPVDAEPTQPLAPATTACSQPADQACSSSFDSAGAASCSSGPSPAAAVAAAAAAPAPPAPGPGCGCPEQAGSLQRGLSSGTDGAVEASATGTAQQPEAPPAARPEPRWGSAVDAPAIPTSTASASTPDATPTPTPPTAPSPSKVIAVARHCPEDLLTDEWTIDDYVLMRKLYESSLSVIAQAVHRQSGRTVALKIYKRSRLREMERFQLAREICLHVRVVHPSVLSLYASWKDAHYVYLLLEWAPRGNLYDYLVAHDGRMEEAEAATRCMQPLLSVLAHLQTLNYIHRDIKLENVLLDAAGQVKVADFGLAIDRHHELANTRLGTFGYFAPEVLDCPLKRSPFELKDRVHLAYDCKVDVWSLGVVAFELLTGKAPFAANSGPKILEAIKTRPLLMPEQLSADARDFLSQMLTRDPVKRPTAKQLLAHPWVVRHCGPPPPS